MSWNLARILSYESKNRIYSAGSISDFLALCLAVPALNVSCHYAECRMLNFYWGMGLLTADTLLHIRIYGCVGAPVRMISSESCLSSSLRLFELCRRAQLTSAKEKRYHSLLKLWSTRRSSHISKTIDRALDVIDQQMTTIYCSLELSLGI